MHRGGQRFDPAMLHHNEFNVEKSTFLFFYKILIIVHTNTGDSMITRYEIKDNELFIYLDFNYEFAKINSKNSSLINNIKKYIKDKNIIFTGSTIVLLVSGIVACRIYLTPTNDIQVDNNYKEEQVEEIIPNEDIEEEIEYFNEAAEEITTNESNKNLQIKQNNKKSNNSIQSLQEQVPVETPVSVEEPVDTNIYVTLRRSSGEVITLELEEYVIGVVGYEMPVSFNIEALKSQAVIARTYALKTISRGQTLTDNNSTQGYKSNSELQALWGSSYNTYYNKIRNAVMSTKGEYLSYNGTYIDCVYHSTSNGKTESSSNVWGNYYPYLVSVDSIYDYTNPSFQKDIFYDYETISSKLGMLVDSNTNFNILSYTVGNRIDSIEINNNIMTGVELRNKLGLRSADIEIIKNEQGVTFRTKGYGHGVGLSQYGANGYANNGYSYRDILRHYYTGAVISKL